jgi:hypothetical protein
MRIIELYFDVKIVTRSLSVSRCVARVRSFRAARLRYPATPPRGGLFRNARSYRKQLTLTSTRTWRRRSKNGAHLRRIHGGRSNTLHFSAVVKCVILEYSKLTFWQVFCAAFWKKETCFSIVLILTNIIFCQLQITSDVKEEISVKLFWINKLNSKIGCYYISKTSGTTLFDIDDHNWRQT